MGWYCFGKLPKMEIKFNSEDIGKVVKLTVNVSKVLEKNFDMEEYKIPYKSIDYFRYSSKKDSVENLKNSPAFDYTSIKRQKSSPDLGLVEKITNPVKIALITGANKMSLWGKIIEIEKEELVIAPL